MTQEEGDVDPVPAVTEPSAGEAPRTCAWCGTAAASPEATSCSNCGAALAQRESIGDLAIPGLTAVDAALQDYDKRPLRLRGPSPSQGMAPALIVGAMAGGPIGLAAIGGVAAVAAAEFLGTRPGRAGGSLESVGKPSEVALQAIAQLGDADAGTASRSDPGPVAAVAADDGRSIWRDLPASADDTPAGPDTDAEGATDGS